MIDEQQVEELRARMARVVIRDDPAWMAEEARPLLASIDETLQQAGDLAFPLPSDLVVALQRVLSTAMDRLENGVEEARRNPRVANIFAAFALRTYLLALVSRVGLPAGFWRTLTGLCLSLLHEGNAAIRGELAWLLALAAADPRFMDARELLWALRWVQSNDPVIVLHRPDAAEEDGFVMSLQLDEPPEPKAWFFKRADSPEPSLSFSLEELAKRAEEEIRQLDGIDWTMRRRVEGGVTADGRVALPAASGLAQAGAAPVLNGRDPARLDAAAEALIAGADPEPLAEYARHLGLAFQVADDILDVTGDPEQTGKRTGKDARLGKATFVSLLGLEGARDKASAIVSKAEAALNVYPDSEAAGNLRQLARFVIHRQT